VTYKIKLSTWTGLPLTLGSWERKLFPHNSSSYKIYCWWL